jgi:hypothetical protein
MKTIYNHKSEDSFRHHQNSKTYNLIWFFCLFLINISMGGNAGLNQQTNKSNTNIISHVCLTCNSESENPAIQKESKQVKAGISAIITPSSTNICLGTTITLAGSYTGDIGSTPTYQWTSTGPQTLTFTPSSTSQNTAITPIISGTYTVSLKVSTIIGGVIYNDTKTITITVNKKSLDPVAITPSAYIILSGNSTTLTLIGGGGGSNEEIHWYSSSCGGTPVGIGNNISVSPMVTTTYYGRYENPAPCNYNSACVQITILVVPVIKIWTGVLSTDFGNATNWLDLSVPKDGQHILFSILPFNDCILDRDRIVGHIINTSSKNLSTSTHNLTINGTLIFTGTGKIDATTAIGAVTFAGASAQTLPSSYFISNFISNLNINNVKGVNLNGNLTVNRKLSLSNGAFTINANTLTLNDSLKITSGSLIGGTTSNLIIGGRGTNLTLPSITLKNITLNRANGSTLGGALQIYGVLALTNGTLTLGPNSMTLFGTSPTVATGLIDATNTSSNITFANGFSIILPAKIFTNSVNYIKMNGSGGIQLSEDVSISKTLELVRGKINTGSNALVFENTANNIVGGNATSYINGFCKKIGNTAFYFTIGNTNRYAPMGISDANGGGNMTDAFLASYHGISPHPTYDITLHESSIVVVSSMEYWTLDRSGTNNVAVTLSWNTWSGVTSLSDLLVVRWDGTKWINHNNVTTTGNASSGTITSNLVSNFSPFTLGSINKNTDPLPIELSDFSAECLNNGPLIRWTTLSELNNNYFVIEQSIDAIQWIAIHQTPGASNSTSERNYTYIGEYSLNTDYFYRLKSVDFDGTYYYSPLVFLKSCSDNYSEFTLYPVPSEGIINLGYSGDVDKIDKIGVYDIMGKMIFSHSGFINSIDLSDQPDGTYYVIAFYNDKRFVNKVILIK